MAEIITRPLLILGVQRSGTTLLASMLGRHSEINMLFESTTTDVLKLIGKKYQGNKLCTYRQIRMNERATKWGHLLNRLANINLISTRYQVRRPAPTSHLSVDDYLNAGAVIITIRREQEAVVKSLMNRTPLNQIQATQEYNKATAVLDLVSTKAIEVSFADLVENPVIVMKQLCTQLDLKFEERMLEGPAYNIIYPQKGFNEDRVSN